MTNKQNGSLVTWKDDLFHASTTRDLERHADLLTEPTLSIDHVIRKCVSHEEELQTTKVDCLQCETVGLLSDDCES